jgi:hypothetical protein
VRSRSVAARPRFVQHSCIGARGARAVDAQHLPLRASAARQSKLAQTDDTVESNTSLETVSCDAASAHHLKHNAAQCATYNNLPSTTIVYLDSKRLKNAISSPNKRMKYDVQLFLISRLEANEHR